MNIFKRLSSGTILIFVLLASTLPLFPAEGWYLLIPPRSDYHKEAAYLQGFSILDSKPLSQWAQQGSYDSASACEAVRDTFTKAAHETFLRSSNDYGKAVKAGTDALLLETQRYITERNNADVSAWMASRCIQSNDPRLRQ